MTRARGTALGALAIAAWSCYGVLLASNHASPPFTAMAIVFSCASAVLLLRRIILGQGLAGVFSIPASTLVLGFIGLFGSNCLYVVALAMGGNPVSVNIASLSWPVFMVVLVAGFGIARATWLDAAAMVLGFAGVTLLAAQGSAIAIAWPVVLAVLGALSWAIYSAFRTKVPAGPANSMIGFVGLSALVCWAISLLFETGMPPFAEFIRLVLVGIIPVGLANLAWDLGARHGDPVLLAGLSFLEPIASTALIAYVLSKPVSTIDIGALSLVLIAVLFSIMSERLRRRRASLLPAA